MSQSYVPSGEQWTIRHGGQCATHVHFTSTYVP